MTNQARPRGTLLVEALRAKFQISGGNHQVRVRRQEMEGQVQMGKRVDGGSDPDGGTGRWRVRSR